jgi:hypothetical protein
MTRDIYTNERIVDATLKAVNEAAASIVAEPTLAGKALIAAGALDAITQALVNEGVELEFNPYE